MKLKTYVFTLDQVKGGTLIKTITGNYSVEVYVKVVDNWYKKYHEFKMYFDMERYNKGSSIYTGRINFPYQTFDLGKIN